MIYKNPIASLSKNISRRGGLARSNFFALTFTGPASLSPNPFFINTICESAQLPGRSITTFEHGTTHQVTKRPYSFINEDVTLTFLITNDFYIKDLFDKWMRCVVNDTTAKIAYKNQYVSDMTITVLDVNHNTVYSVNLENAYPININSIELSNADGQILKLTVTMTYDNYTSKSSHFSLITSLENIKDAISFPNPFMPSVPFYPFGDLGNQKEALIKGLKSAAASELSGIMNSITAQVREKLLAGTSSITTSFQGSLTDVKSQISGKVKTLFGTASKSIGSSLTSIVSGASSKVTSLVSSAKNLRG